MDRVSPKVLALLAALTLVWGTNWVLFKIALDELPVFTFRTLVLVTGILVLGVILRVRGERFAVPKGKWPALIAVAALMMPNFQSYARAPAGLFWGLFAGLCWAVGTFIVKRTSWPGMGLSLTFWQIVISLPPILLGAVLFDGLPAEMPSAQALIATIYTGAVPMALGTAAWFALVKLLPAQVAAL